MDDLSSPLEGEAVSSVEIDTKPTPTAMRLSIAVQSWNIDELKLLTNYAQSTKKDEISLDVLNSSLAWVLNAESILSKSYEIIKILINHGAQLVTNNDTDADVVYDCFSKFVREKIKELRSFTRGMSRLPKTERDKAEVNLVEILELAVTRGGAGAALAKLLQDQTIVADCSDIPFRGERVTNSTFPLLKFFLDRGLNTQLCEDLLNTSLAQNWGFSALLIEFGTNGPSGWDLRKYLHTFQVRYPSSKSKIEQGLQRRHERWKLICQHLFQSISPVSALCAPSFDVSPLCTVIAEYYFQL